MALATTLRVPCLGAPRWHAFAAPDRAVDKETLSDWETDKVFPRCLAEAVGTHAVTHFNLMGETPCLHMLYIATAKTRQGR